MNNIEEFHALLRAMVEKQASDLFLTAGSPPCLKVHGSFLPIGIETLSSHELLLDLSLNLKAVVAQQSVPKRLALEILLKTPLIARLIHKGELQKLKEVMKKSTILGMQTFDQALLKLYEAGEISYEDALHHADAPNELRLLVKLGKDGGIDKLHSALDGMELIEPRR